MYLISIITPIYNAMRWFAETYLSVVNQTFSDFEWIIIDDCSTDGSYNFVENLIKKHGNIRLLKTKQNGGAAKARNLGIEAAEGRFIAFLDSDDIWQPKKIELQINFMIKNGYSFTYTNYEVLKKNGKKILFNPKASFADYKRLLKTCDIGCLTVIYDTNVIGKIFMPLDTPKREDYATWLDITKRGIVAHKLNENLAVYRISPDSVSSKKISMVKYHYNVYRHHERFSVFKSLWFLLIHSCNKIFKKY